MSENVISINDHKNKESLKEEDSKESFEDIMKKNKEKKEKIEKDRLQKNKSVLRNYRLGK